MDETHLIGFPAWGRPVFDHHFSHFGVHGNSHWDPRNVIAKFNAWYLAAYFKIVFCNFASPFVPRFVKLLKASTRLSRGPALFLSPWALFIFSTALHLSHRLYFPAPQSLFPLPHASSSISSGFQFYCPMLHLLLSLGFNSIVPASARDYCSSLIRL